ncbi:MULTISPECIES: fumarylacetoacetate hydrolase family protein [unclassified Achromobacter]|uniref:fumarylacetoacetate hydrolase family protein n=1 Tax=unclassified Achromobacter TaxID=2626865 RepID=UPI00069CFAAE|nr:MULTISPECIES: fumarylacetoacetate hydrolase family protein [unclassified Achromobacter]KOF52348.1 2-hydroxyhepta-2,4-diene-1,7-dioate isomerase [Achromobacter sp. DMS1]KOF52573.1 2-hydroxyhepta-2,4-diene-1,7-dioate isomerase [Achromobacter sp. DMS1]
MKHGRIRYEGRVVEVTEGADGRVRLPDGRLLDEAEAQWLPPLEFGTVFVLGLNYADHAKEIAFNKAPEEPLVFLKGPNALQGHRGKTWRPADVDYMHFECELGVVIGKTCRNVPRQRAYDVVAGYCAANDYAIRDYLENFYRPNLRVKNRDGATPVGPWFVDAADIPDPMNLRLRSWVNGELKQDGNTRDMVHDIPALIAHLSGFMTLNPGDLILTGTPVGVADSKAGDEIVTEVEGVGRLVNTIAGEPPAPPSH